MPPEIRQDNHPQLLFRDEGDHRAHAVDRTAVLDDHPPAVLAEYPAKPVNEQARLRVSQSPKESLAPHPLGSDDGLGRLRLLDRFGGQQPFPLVNTSFQLKAHPLGHIRDARVDRARGTNIVDVAIEHSFDLAFDLLVGGGHVFRMAQDHSRGIAIGHLQWSEDALLDEVIPALASDGRDDLTSRHVHDVLVTELAAEARGHRSVAESADHLLPTDRCAVPKEIMTGQATPMAEQVAHRHLPGGIGIGELEVTQMLDDRVIPTDLTIINQHRQGSGRERLATGSDSEQRLLIDWGRFAQLAHAVAFGEAYGIPLDDRDS